MRFSERTLKKMERRGAVVERTTPKQTAAPMKFLFDVSRDDNGRIKSITATQMEREREE